jgi:hypothetical protein
LSGKWPGDEEIFDGAFFQIPGKIHHPFLSGDKRG